MRGTALLLAGGLVALPLPAAAARAGGQCADILPANSVAEAKRPVTPEDLVRLRDIGPPDLLSRMAPLFTLSPDGRSAAFQLRRADPERNTYCIAMVVLDLANAEHPRTVDRGGDPMLVEIDTRGRANVPTGIFASVTPRWAPDGRWIAFLRRDRGRNRVWRAEADGSESHPLTPPDLDVVDFRIAPSGAAIVYATRPGVERARAAIEKEGLRGFHFDDRYSPTTSTRPFVPLPAPRHAAVLDLLTGATRAASAEEAALVGAATDGATSAAVDASKEDIWISAARVTGGAEPGALHARRMDGSVATCSAPECTGATDPWRGPRNREVQFFRREGAANDKMAIYAWNPETGSVRLLYITEDLMADCARSGSALVCLRESSLQPRRLERLDPETGTRAVLFDPNPEFRHLELGAVERLHWRNDIGMETIGDLVRPIGYRPGQRYPLIVVQYDTRGFLRGGTGDDYPIQAFAARGYAVLSVRRPTALALLQGKRTLIDVERYDLEGYRDRKSVLSSVVEGVRLAISKGVADPKRLGITGLSDGTTTTTFAIINQPIFAAAAVSSCCIDTTLPARVGPVGAREFYAVGYPRLIDPPEPVWKPISPRLNARSIRTPILIQVSEHEVLSATESYTAMREAKAPVDMFVFPDEYHLKSQPAHRLAVYRRSLDWFDYWLMGIRSTAPERQAELLHWDSLKEEMSSGRHE